jgi:hypothetical protein
MTDENKFALHDIATNRDLWLSESRWHYQELAAWLREIAGKCRLPNPQKELLDITRLYERRADHLGREASYGAMIGEPPSKLAPE